MSTQQQIGLGELDGARWVRKAQNLSVLGHWFLHCIWICNVAFAEVRALRQAEVLHFGRLLPLDPFSQNGKKRRRKAGAVITEPPAPVECNSVFSLWGSCRNFPGRRKIKLLCASMKRFGFQTYRAPFPDGLDPYVFIRMQWKKKNPCLMSNQVVISGNMLMMQCTSELLFRLWP